MTAPDIERERAEFSAWAQRRMEPLARLDDGTEYSDMRVQALWEGWLAAKRASQPAPSGGDGLTDAQALALVEVVRAEQNLPSLAFPTDRAIIAFARAIAARIIGQCGEDAR